jgi:hypothetical protein
MSAIKKDNRRIQHLLTSKYGLRILARIYSGYRPSQIAEQLHISVQNVNYYTTILTDLNFIEKLGGRKGISWKVTERGLFILKQFIRWSVNSSNNHNDLLYDAKIPVRLHDVTFSFKVNSSFEHLKILWKDIKNGVSRYTVIKKNREDENTVDLIKTSNLVNSVMLIHVKEAYTFNSYKEIIRLYEAARATAIRTAAELRIEIFSTGELVKKPHLAFESDVIASYLATFETASIKTRNNKGRAWIDASHGVGELETNDPDYAYKYLTMPENVFDLSNDIRRMESKVFGFKRCYDPLVTDNN